MGRDILRHHATPEPGPTPVQAQVILALVGGATIKAAAAESGVDRSTVYRWLNEDPEFVAELNRSRQEQLERIRGELRGLAADAVGALRELITSGETPPAVRLKAALSALGAIGGITVDPIGATQTEEVRRGWEQLDLIRMLGSIS